MNYDKAALRACGIYAIVNDVTGRIYIGMTTASFGKRWIQHRHELGAGLHCNPELQRDWFELGADAFSFAIVHRFDGLPRYGYDYSMRALEGLTIRTSECWLYNTANTYADPNDAELIGWLYSRPHG